MKPRYLPPSANGFAMIDHGEDASYYLVACWKAYAYVYFGEGLLFHVEDAEQFESMKTRGKCFDADFNPA